MTFLTSIMAIVIGYALGSIPPAYILGRVFHGVDIRTQGSGNVGGANAGRLFGKKIFAAVALFDIFKGTAAILIARALAVGNVTEVGFFSTEQSVVVTAGFFAVFGHCYSIWLKFSGGKGGATTAGVLLAIDPLSFVIMLVFWVVIVATTRFTSLGNLLGIVVIAVLLNIRMEEIEYTYLGLALTALIYWKHRENIGRLIRREERKFGKKEAIQK